MTGRSRPHAKSIGTVLAAAALLSSAPVWAQKPPAERPGSLQQTVDKMAEARRRYRLGLDLYQDGNYDAARIEFERALQMAPSYKILYNIGLTYKQLNDYVQAQIALERYLFEGGSEIAADRRADVEKEITGLKGRIAHVNVKANVPRGTVQVDDVAVGELPLAEPLSVNPGRRKISITRPGFLPATKVVTIGSSETSNISLELSELPKSTILERKSNPWTVPTVVGWSATAAAGIATGILGALTLNAKHDQEEKLQSVGTSAEDRTNARDKTQTFATATDILGITTVVFAGVSTYFTVRLLSHTPEIGEAEKPKDVSRTEIRLVPAGPTGLGVVGSF
ncbi:tetratricopeptide repeat protein [Pendulispora brunnea]|uniref:Tetratricopeptide repeat protein n=1 Tax=Pendulispora brunnea TaxID=2905690 RepID=A0ABZ2JWM9_9BACT